jgi:hypothetical protein
MYRQLLLIAIILLPFAVLAQTFPREGAVLHYRIVAFRLPAVAGAENYQLEIATGDNKKFRKSDIEATGNDTTIVAELPAFGTKYTWRYKAMKGNKKLFTSDAYHFSTGYSHFADTHEIRIQVSIPYTNQDNYYFFSDKSRTLYTMAGQPVWYLPEIPGVVDSNALVRDLKVSPQGTITFLNNTLAVEIDYNGQLLWRSPAASIDSQQTPGLFHHELTRLGNGNYMVLGAERTPGVTTESNRISGRLAPRKIPEGTIVELDPQNNVKWFWRSSSFYRPENLQTSTKRKMLNDTHENAFYFDEKNGYIYASFKNTNQILKIKYPDGTVTKVYGRRQDDTLSELPFCTQHSCKLTSGGQIVLYNNNGCNRKTAPSLVFLNEVSSEKLYDIPLKTGEPEAAGAGGNVMEIDNNTFFVSASAPYSDIIVINTTGKELYHSRIETLSPMKDKWESFSQYRASLLNKQDFKKMILKK